MTLGEPGQARQRAQHAAPLRNLGTAKHVRAVLARMRLADPPSKSKEPALRKRLWVNPSGIHETGPALRKAGPRLRREFATAKRGSAGPSTGVPSGALSFSTGRAASSLLPERSLVTINGQGWGRTDRMMTGVRG